MALLFCDGFPYDNTAGNRYDQAGYWYQSGEWQVYTGGRWGARYLHMDAGDRYAFALKNIPASNPVMFQCGLSVAYASAGESDFLGFWDAGGNVICFLSIVCPTGYIKAYRGNPNSKTLIATSTAPITTGWGQLEVKNTINAGAGIFLVKWNGTTIMNAGTLNNGAASCASISFGPTLHQSWWNNLMTQFYWSDIIMMDTSGSYCNDLLGARMVKPLMPTADSATYKEWSRSAGANNYANVDEIPPNGDTDYNYTSTVGARDLFTIPDLSAGANAAIDAVVCSMYAKMGDAGAGKMKGLCRLSSTDAEGSEIVLPSSYAYGQSVFYRDPATNAWTIANFNSAEFGYKRSA